MSKKGCSPDNSAMEGFFGQLKVEFFYGRDWSGWSIHGFMDALDEYIHWYNEEGIKLSLGGMSPMRYRRSLGLGEGKISWTPSQGRKVFHMTQKRRRCDKRVQQRRRGWSSAER